MWKNEETRMGIAIRVEIYVCTLAHPYIRVCKLAKVPFDRLRTRFV